VSRAPGVALLGLTLCLVAALFDTPALYVAGAALALIAVAGELLAVAVARTTRLERGPARATVQEGEPLSLSLALSGPLAGLGAARVVAWPGAEASDLRRTGLRGGRGRGRAIALEARLPRRGRHLLGPSQLRIADPFAISTRTLQSDATEVLVLPRIEPLPRGALRLAGSRSGGRARAGAPRGGAAVDADSLQPHRPGAPASRIHWPTVARTGRLHERRLGADADRRPLVVLDTDRPDSEAALDACVRAAASLCRGLGERGGCTLLLPGEPRALALMPGLQAWPHLHARLALAPAGVAPASAPVRRAATVVWVSAAREAPDSSALAGGAQLLIITPFPRAGHPIDFELAGCAAQVVDVRPRARRRAAPVAGAAA
jgi:uncharacterized protein (DUF58 family)